MKCPEHGKELVVDPVSDDLFVCPVFDFCHFTAHRRVVENEAALDLQMPSGGFRVALCKECDQEFRAKVVYYRRKDTGKSVARHDQWCSKECRRDYFRRVTAKSQRMTGS